ncbi:sodium/proline symporter PutP [Alcaligenes endophyticus]|uniref:Sodium/proline symporter n=1 Tax=Alcaligenes endophyticus TaxID=1929088 RepID=A0ABT8EIN9_9BURK|nr:sodium/proline symporter PutP [Alcaligenes endophyticus]MCX5592421.1 sodium/proline symporter PutP [Alcaligenes endophyticus]MDN4121146.1 sodium/proline symporter PutP [Alcaligenes endophyticus]
MSTPIVIMFAIYIAIMLLIGWFGYRSTQDLSDYILGGRKLGAFVVALAAGASDMSGWLLMGLPGAIYTEGISASWIAIGLIIGAYLNWLFVAPRLRVYTERSGDALTLPDYFSNRFDDRNNILRIVSAVVILVFFTLYCASGVVAGARLFESMFNMPYHTALWVGAVCTIAYVFIGGFLAVSWTDTVQASLMFTALVLTPLFILNDVGGAGEAVSVAQQVNINSVNMLSGVSTLGVLSALAWGLGYFGQPHILVRFMAADSVQTIPNARRIGMTWMILCLAGAVAVGFFGIAYFHANPELASGVEANAERVFIELSILLFNPWVAGVLLAAILAAVMSTLSAQLLVCSSSLTQDIYKTFIKRDASDQQLVWFGRTMVLAVALVAIYLASDPNSRVLSMVSYAWAGFGAAFGPVVLLSLVWSRMTRAGALAGMITGALVVLLWKRLAWIELYEIVPGFLLAGVAIYLVSMMTAAPSRETTELFDAVQRETRSGS